jgi:hypothetical protein
MFIIANLSYRGSEVDRPGSKSNPLVNFGISCDEPLGSAAKVLVF